MNANNDKESDSRVRVDFFISGSCICVQLQLTRRWLVGLKDTLTFRFYITHLSHCSSFMYTIRNGTAAKKSPNDDDALHRDDRLLPNSYTLSQKRFSKCGLQNGRTGRFTSLVDMDR